ncbi:hypothetical protein [Streptomyces sp. RB17]|uniref:hypothetical protein n=1 Tax=Streptomyces sp. RB17 TaxID=2585197 RepID=UPI001296E44A|nr:hypothetical protein [Streptomyces sp. RB17]
MIEKLDNSITDFGLVDAFPEDVKEARQRYYAPMHMGDRATGAMRWHGGPASPAGRVSRADTQKFPHTGAAFGGIGVSPIARPTAVCASSPTQPHFIGTPL